MEDDILISANSHALFDVFISYGRLDSKAFALKLYSQLAIAGYNIWLDLNDIPVAVDFQEQIKDGIERSKNFLFVISPHSVNSVYCQLEIELALKYNKRIIPLLHVEQINQEIWRQRNPNGTDEQWEDYRARGLHSSYPNMHPAIQSINWVNFQNEVDGFDAALTNLKSALERHQSYVYHHTVLLSKALSWSRHHRKTHDLLTGKELELAEAWLKTRFKGEQAPCNPTELHAEFITESIKNEQNLMTQVFLSYANEDREIMEKVRHSLRYQGITVWSTSTDIQIGEDFTRALRRGIEQSDNLVYLMSSDSLQSEYCQMEIEYAHQLNKRIVPLLLRLVDMNHVPFALHDLQYIDLTTVISEDNYHTCEAQLLNTLRQNENYHRQHKLLLVRALKWEYQYDNPSILLQGSYLRQAEAWLKEAVHHPQFAPLPIHQEFIEASQQQPHDQTFNVFIGYSPLDIEFVRKFNDNLQLQGMGTWFAQESLESGQDSQLAIQQGIENSDNFLFVISPNSIQSTDCLDQLNYAVSLNKRLVTVLYQDVPPHELPPVLSTIQWIDFRDHQDDLLKSFGELIRLLASDPEYVQLHTRLLVKAKEWVQSNRDDDLLLRGKPLKTAMEWLAIAETKEPKLTPLQQDYIQASQALPFRKIKLRSALFTSVAAMILVAIARVLGFLQPLELRAYDSFVQLRPVEPLDPHLLIVKVDSSSGSLLREQMINRVYQPGIGTIPDAALNDVLKILESHQPRLIGLDFYRDFPAEPILRDRLANSPNIIGNCLSRAWDNQGNPTDGIPNRTITDLESIGFANALADGTNRLVRRQLLISSADPEFCNTDQSFSLVLVRRYLDALNKPFIHPDEPSSDGVMRFGETPIPLLRGDGSGYSPLDPLLGGYQLMLNYRVGDRTQLSSCVAQPSAKLSDNPVETFADTVTLADVLQNKVAAECIRDRIVLIGYTDTSDRNADVWFSPHGRIAGVFLQGQMISQLISTVLDQRPLIWWMSMEGELLWILGWSITGGLVFWGLVRPIHLCLATTGAFVLLVGSCYGIFIVSSGWMPLVPGAIAFVISGAGVAYLSYRIRNPW
ncbi:MAG: TIR domain-containing protein [Oculatellaceae cyanobacterium bins.114]|nr:TIR domain-containing protein [Oculatellaceae cyanobacterium bins.114]